MLPGNRKFAVNVAANALTGGSSAVLAIALPYVLVRHLAPSEFSIWVLSLQLAGYVNYLNFGLQIAVGRYVAHALARDDREQAAEIVSASVQMLLVLGTAGAVLIAALTAAFPLLFKQLPAASVDEARATLALVGAATSLSLPFSAFVGFFIGNQRNDIPAVITFVGNLLLAISVTGAVAATGNIVIAAFLFFLSNVAVCVLQLAVFRRQAAWCRLALFRIEKRAWSELASYCLSLAGFSFAMLLVTGLDTTIVGIFDFRRVAAYGVSATAVLILLGVVRAILGPTIQVFARFHARNEIERLANLLCVTSEAFTTFLIVTGAWLVVAGYVIFPLWIGPQLGKLALPIFFILMIANVLRNTPAPYSHYLIATAQQKKIVLAPLLEGASNLAASAVLAYWFGAIGVAYGTLIGAIVGVAANPLYTIPRTAPPGFGAARFVGLALGIPALTCCPLIAASVYVTASAPNLAISACLMLLCTTLPVWRIVQAWRTTESRIVNAAPPVEHVVTG